MEGICPKCGASYYGWTLDNAFEQKCEICGNDLDVFDGREHIEENQSPCEYLKYEISTDKRDKENTDN